MPFLKVKYKNDFKIKNKPNPENNDYRFNIRAKGKGKYSWRYSKTWRMSSSQRRAAGHTE
jgi:hypothetical protein